MLFRFQSVSENSLRSVPPSRSGDRKLFGRRRKENPRLPYRLKTSAYWTMLFGLAGPKEVQSTVRKVAEHARDIFAADLNYPIIMTASGDVLDGAHRIAKAHLQGAQMLSAFLIDELPEPDGFVKGGG
jgi:hypothetical protein